MVVGKLTVMATKIGLKVSITTDQKVSMAMGKNDRKVSIVTEEKGLKVSKSVEWIGMESAIVSMLIKTGHLQEPLWIDSSRHFDEVLIQELLPSTVAHHHRHHSLHHRLHHFRLMMIILISPIHPHLSLIPIHLDVLLLSLIIIPSMERM